MSAAILSPPLSAAVELADTLLRPQAERVDVQGVPRSHLDALAAAGLLGVTAPADVGGGGETASTGRLVTEVLAGACGATWFVWAQHALPLATVLKSTNAAVRDRYLRPLADGTVLSGVAVAHLRRSGPPAVTASRCLGGWRLDGHVDWMTAWGLCDVFMLGAVAGDEVVLALVDARESDALHASDPMPLAAMQGTRTVTLHVEGFFVPDDQVVEVAHAETWLAADRVKTANASAHTFGLHREIVRRLKETAQRRGEPTAGRLAGLLEAEGEDLRGQAYRLIEQTPAVEQVGERLRLRAASLDLVMRSATALMTASGGGGMSLDAAPQRLAREALFQLVQAQTAPVREATLQLLADSVPGATR